MANTVEYTIQVNKTGAGAAQATADFTAVKRAAAGTNETFTKTEVTTGGMAKGFKALNGVLVVAGLQTFPQLTAGVMVTKSALDGLRASGVQLQAGLGTMALGIAGLTAIVITGAQAWLTYRANKQEALSAKNLDEQTEEFAGRLRTQLEESKAAGDITNDTFRRLSATLGTLAGNKQVIEFFREMRGGNAGDLMAEQNRGFANTRAQLAFANPNFATDKAQQQIQLQSEYNDQVKLYNFMREEGMITEQQLSALTTEADTNRLNSIVQLRKQLTELQKLGQQAAETFSSGLANAIVRAFTEGGKAFKEFAANFLAQMAQMILQTIIFNAIKNSSFGGMIGLAQGGVRFAASGLAGVQSVASPTYFPKFNVVAGEAGREMLTVLARPRMMEVGGVAAVVGSAQGRQMAITDASALERGGAGGTIVIQVQGTPDFEARVVSNSVKGAVVQVANDMRQDTPIARGVKGLTA